MALRNILTGMQPEGEINAWQESFLNTPKLYAVKYNLNGIGSFYGKVILVRGEPAMFSIPVIPAKDFRYLHAAIIDESGKTKKISSDNDPRLVSSLIFDCLAYKNIKSVDNPDKVGEELINNVKFFLDGSIDTESYRTVIKRADRVQYAARSIDLVSVDHDKSRRSPGELREKAKFLSEIADKLGIGIKIEPIARARFIQELNELLSF